MSVTQQGALLFVKKNQNIYAVRCSVVLPVNKLLRVNRFLTGETDHNI
jgi:hypothetical protein